MITTFIIILSIAAAIYFFLKKVNQEKKPSPFDLLGLPILIVAAGIFIGFIQPFSLELIDGGSIGMKVNLTGDERGVSEYKYKTGRVVVNSWVEQLYQYPVSQQHLEYDTLTVFTKGGFPVKIKPSLNYSLKPSMVGDMFTSLRKPIKEVEQGWLLNAILSSINDVANRYTIDSIFNDRELFEASIVYECNKRVKQWFTVSQLRPNIFPPPALQNAIIAKTKAIQDAQAEDAKVLTAEAMGRKKIAEAKADSAFKVITAKGSAEAEYIKAVGDGRAMKERQRELSPLYIDYVRASNWNGAYPSTMLGNGTNTLYQLK